MHRPLLLALALSAALCAGDAPAPAAVPAAAPDADGFVALFNGTDLTGWEGKPEFWSVKDGAITGTSTKEVPTKGNTFLIWRGGTLTDFELRLSFRLENHNSGVQFRSKDKGNSVVNGYQADIAEPAQYKGILYEEGGRGIIANAGTKVVIGADGKNMSSPGEASADAVKAAFKDKTWNDMVILAQGNHLIQKVNGVVCYDLTDNQEAKRALTGILALQLHAGPPMVVQFKDIKLKPIK